MYPLLFTIPFLPGGLGEIKSYGFMLMIGFLLSIWLAARRAMRVQANPDVLLNVGLISLVAGVVGARIMFVWHYWDDRFATQDSPIWAAIRIDQGGLEFWGGPLLTIPCVMFYLWKSRNSLRWYLDIIAPSLMFGLTFGRIGCLLNGCCWGGVCTAADAHLHDPVPENVSAGLPWTLRFPYGSPAMMQQFEFRQMTLPKELVWIAPSGESMPLPRQYVDMSQAEFDAGVGAIAAAEAELAEMSRSGASQEALTAQHSLIAQEKYRLKPLIDVHRVYGIDQTQLQELASHYWSLPVQPAQVYGAINAMFLSWVLSLMFYRRQRHGVVFGWMIVLYSCTRFLLELIRQDQPLDFGGLTISQQVSLFMLGFAALYFWYIRRLPVKSPLAEPFVYEDEETRQPVKARPA